MLKRITFAMMVVAILTTAVLANDAESFSVGAKYGATQSMLGGMSGPSDRGMDKYTEVFVESSRYLPGWRVYYRFMEPGNEFTFADASAGGYSYWPLRNDFDANLYDFGFTYRLEQEEFFSLDIETGYHHYSFTCNSDWKLADQSTIASGTTLASGSFVHVGLTGGITMKIWKINLTPEFTFRTNAGQSSSFGFTKDPVTGQLNSSESSSIAVPLLYTTWGYSISVAVGI